MLLCCPARALAVAEAGPPWAAGPHCCHVSKREEGQHERRRELGFAIGFGYGGRRSNGGVVVEELLLSLDIIIPKSKQASTTTNQHVVY